MSGMGIYRQGYWGPLRMVSLYNKAQLHLHVPEASGTWEELFDNSLLGYLSSPCWNAALVLN